MKAFRFFFKKIFLRKALITLSIVSLLFIVNYITFTLARSFLSTAEGSEEMAKINQPGVYISNVDLDSERDIGELSDKEIEETYNYLNDNFSYAFYTEGFVADVPNKYDMDVTLAYMNENYYKVSDVSPAEGDDLNFNYTMGNSGNIPVLVGAGLREEYPIGSAFTTHDPGLEKDVTFEVRGVLPENKSHSNMYALNSKQYYNFSIFIPANDEYIEDSSSYLKLNGLTDLILLKTSKDDVSLLKNYTHEKLGVDFNYYTQKENNEFYYEYFTTALRAISIISISMIAVVSAISIWSTLVSIRLMIKDFTINLLVGLSYGKLRKILSTYFGILFTLNIIVLLALTSYARYGSWSRKESTFATYGFLGLIEMDWLSLLSVACVDIVIGIIIVEVMMWRIKKVPISLGVLQ